MRLAHFSHSTVKGISGRSLIQRPLSRSEIPRSTTLAAEAALKRDGKDQDGAGEHEPELGAVSVQAEHFLQVAERERAEHGEEHATAPPAGAGAAEHAHRDGVELVAEAGLGVPVSLLSGLTDPAERGEKPRKHVCEQ